MKKKFRALIIIVLILIAFLSGIFVYDYLLNNNKYVRQWDELPSEVRLHAAQLEMERCWNLIFPPQPDFEILDKITPEKIRYSVRLGANWIISMQEESGRYNYWYDPSTDKYSEPWDDNFLRQAGTSYALMLAYQVTGDSNCLKSAMDNVEYLLTFRRETESGASYFLFNNKAKLGGVALPMLTMLKYKIITGDTLYDDLLTSLGEMILYLQEKYGTGQFKSTYVYRGDYEYEKTSGWESNIYPGEAMLALVYMYQAFDNKLYKEALDWAYDYYSEKGRWRVSSLITWTTSAFSELYKTDPEKKYAEFIMDMCNYTLKSQNLCPDNYEYGSFYGLPNVFTATSFEGIADAIPVMEMINEKKLAEKYKLRSLMAYNWLFKLQFADSSSSIPAPAYGGFRTNAYDSLIRIDNTQHAVSALIKGLWYIFDEEKLEAKTEI